MRKTLKATLLQSLAFMGLLFVLNLSLRAVFIFYFKDSVNGINLAQWELFLANAFRYDGQIIGVMSVVFFALNFVPKRTNCEHLRLFGAFYHRICGHCKYRIL